MQVPLQVDISEMLTHWQWFGEWSIGCIGILNDWVVETVSSITRAGKTALTIDDLKKHALGPASTQNAGIESARAYNLQEKRFYAQQ